MVVTRAKSSSSIVGIHWLLFKFERSRQSRISFLFRNMEAKSRVQLQRLGTGDSHPVRALGEMGWGKWQLFFVSGLKTLTHQTTCLSLMMIRHFKFEI